MKKFTVIMLSFVFGIVLISCGKTVSITSVTEETTVTTGETTLIPVISQAEIETFTDVSVTLELSFYLNSSDTEVLETMITSFESDYPNVDIVATKESDDAAVSSSFKNLVMGGGDAPDIILTGQEYLAMVTNGLEPLDSYLNATTTYNGISVGIPETELEMNLFTNHMNSLDILSFPYTRETQVVFANTELLSQYANDLKMNSVDVTNDGFLDNGYPLNFDNLDAFYSVVDNEKTILTFEKPSLTMETWLAQQGVIWVEESGYMINQTSIRNLMFNMRSWTGSGAFSLADGYSSTSFNNGDTVFALSDSSSLRYMTGGNFTVEILPMVTKGEQGGIFYGSDFGISSYSNNAEKFFSWMFIRYMTDLNKGYLTFCLENGYTPIQNETVYESMQDYIDCIAFSNTFSDSDNLPSWSANDFNWQTYHLSMIQVSYQFSRTNVSQRSFFSAVNAGEVERVSNLWNQYLDNVCNTEQDIESILIDFEDDLNVN